MYCALLSGQKEIQQHVLERMIAKPGNTGDW
jgi:hypothetical protein